MRREEPVAVAPAPHAAQQRPRHVLQRQVEVRHAGGADGVDERVGEVGRVEVEQPHPRRPARPRPRPAARSLRRRRPGRARRRRGPGRRARSPARLELRRPRRGSTSIDAAALRAAEARDGAEAAGPVAALGHLHVGPRRGATPARQVRAGRSRQRRRPGLRPRVTGTPKPATASTSGSAAASSSP